MYLSHLQTWNSFTWELYQVDDHGTTMSEAGTTCFLVGTTNENNCAGLIAVSCPYQRWLEGL